MLFHKPKAKMSRFGLNTTHYHALLYKEHYLTKAKHRKLLQMHFLGTIILRIVGASTQPLNELC